MSEESSEESPNNAVTNVNPKPRYQLINGTKLERNRSSQTAEITCAPVGIGGFMEHKLHQKLCGEGYLENHRFIALTS